ncbi:Glycosyl transferase, family 2 [hydrothermal vent metagenome]|uniref:Glycosyl transferase, family 2 n=1 Tax=hydrothermal vent metagenome TaxID=652676 RepID=A0A3B0ZDB0_9ZZZZ
MPSFPKISIVTPSYNQGEFLEATLVSVLDQRYPNLEYIVIDGGSNDNSIEIIKKYEKHLTYWVSEKDRGQSHAINKGFEKATGELFYWLNSDDKLEPGALETVIENANQYPEIDVFVGHGQKADLLGNVTYYKEPGELSFERLCQWMNGGNFMQPSCFFRRSAWEAAGPLDETLNIALDVDLWLKMVKKVKFQKIDKLLSSALVHEGAKTTAFRNRMVVDCAIVVIQAGGEKFVRKHLDEMADNLSSHQKFYSEIVNHPLIKIIKPFLRPFVKRPY